MHQTHLNNNILTSPTPQYDLSVYLISWTLTFCSLFLPLVFVDGQTVRPWSTQDIFTFNKKTQTGHNLWYLSSCLQSRKWIYETITYMYIYYISEQMSSMWTDMLLLIIFEWMNPLQKVIASKSLLRWAHTFWTKTEGQGHRVRHSFKHYTVYRNFLYSTFF